MKRSRKAAAERIHLDKTSPWWGEHRSRYRFAERFVGGKRVLDCACGSGFGSVILAAAGATVTASDSSFEAVQATKDASGAAVVQADATSLPFLEGCFDVVTSFETIEHIEDDSAFLDELRRVLSFEGVLILSTPNARHTQPVDGKPRNPFHVREYLPDELRRLLERSFDEVKMLGQVGSRRYSFNPYWQHRDDLPRDIVGRARLFVWRVLNRLPVAVRERVSRTFMSRSFYPGEYDFDFSPEGIERGHVTVAICRKRKP